MSNKYTSRSFVLLLFTVLALLMLSFTAATVFSQETKKSDLSPTINETEHAYTIGPEDLLEVLVWHNADLSKTVHVRPDGFISLPLIGDVKAAGSTPSDLKEKIVTRLKEFQDTVVVSVIVIEVNSYKVFILGEVVKPGSYTVKRRTSVLQAIAIAGGFTQYASKNKMVLVREESDTGSKAQKLKIRFDDLVKVGSKMNKTFILRPGDTIFVP